MSKRTKQQKSAARKKLLNKKRNIRKNNVSKFNKRFARMLIESHKRTVLAAHKKRMGLEISEQEGELLAQFRTEGDLLDNE